MIRNELKFQFQLTQLFKTFSMFATLNEYDHQIAFRLTSFFLVKKSSTKLLGSSAFGFQDIYEKVATFVKNWKKMWPEPPLYFCSVDIKHSFDTINQETLSSYVNEIFSQPQYLVRKYNSIAFKGE